MNKITIIGNLTRDPELRATQSGLTVCGFTVAVERRFSQEKEADYIPVTAWRALADNCGKYLKKGSKVAVSGSLRIRSYDKDGEKRYAAEVLADEVEFLSPKKAEEQTELFEQTDSLELPF